MTINIIFPSSIASQSSIARSFTNILGPSHPWPIAVLMETFSTSAFKVLIWIIATTTKICTGRLSTQIHIQSVYKTPTPSPTHCSHIVSLQCSSIGQRTLESHQNFRGWFIRQVSCYTLLSGFRLPWPPSCCQNESTQPFVVSDARAVGHLNSQVRFIPHRQFCLPKHGPLRTCINLDSLK